MQRPAVATRTYPLFPCTTPVRSATDRRRLGRRVADRRRGLPHAVPAQRPPLAVAGEEPIAGAAGIVDHQPGRVGVAAEVVPRSEENTPELQSPMRISYAVFCLQTKNNF